MLPLPERFLPVKISQKFQVVEMTAYLWPVTCRDSGHTTHEQWYKFYWICTLIYVIQGLTLLAVNKWLYCSCVKIIVPLFFLGLILHCAL